MDTNCINLVRALNRLPGITTIESCEGHDRMPFKIWFIADSLDALIEPCYWVDPCHCGQHGWQIIAQTDCAMSPIKFRLEGPVGELAYEGAEEIARVINVAQDEMTLVDLDERG